MDVRIASLLHWYKRHRRDLPWRDTRDPYRIFVSEIMLQQTQVDRVVAYYRRWIKQFPTWQALARARTDALLHAWAGLGYNRRALMLRDAARHVVVHGVPKTIDAWKALRGVGPYTAAAIQAITARQRLIVIDTNVRRVAGRLFLGIPYPVPMDDARVSRSLERAVPRQDIYWEMPQAMMDFATAICTPTRPACASCPLRQNCRASTAFLTGRAGKKQTTPTRERKHGNKPHPDRIYRGRMLAAIRSKRAQTLRALGQIADPSFDATHDGAWIRAMLERLIKDGLVERRNGKLFLPRT